MGNTKFKPGQSGNPKGRPSGKTLSGRLRQAVGKDFDQITAALIAAAKGGDMQAASLLLSRVCPALRPVQDPVNVDMPGDTLTEKGAAILDAVGRGKISVPDGKALIDALAAVAKIQEVDELRWRVEKIEERQHEFESKNWQA